MSDQTIILADEAKRKRALSIISALPLAKRWEVVVRPFRASRSELQNRRYWLLLTAVAEHTGHDKDELHEWFKEKFLGTREIEIAGETRVVSPSTRRLKVHEFHAYMTKVETWTIETLGVWLE